MSNHMRGFVASKRVVLGDHHLRPGRTRHSLNGKDFPPLNSAVSKRRWLLSASYLRQRRSRRYSSRDQWKKPCIKLSSSSECKETNGYPLLHDCEQHRL